MADIAIRNAVIEAGLWPATGGKPACLPLPEPGGDLLPAVWRAWTQQAASLDVSARIAAAVRAEGFRRAQEFGARLTWSIPELDPARTTAWLGCRLAWWPGGVPNGRRVGLVSSRLGQELDRHKSWFAVLRTACMRLDPQQDVLVTAGQTAAQRFVQRCGRLFGLPILKIQAERGGGAVWRDWGRRILASLQSLPAAPDRVLLSPPLTADGPAAVCEELAGLPVPDRAIFALCDHVVALHVRPEGNVMRLLQARLGSPGFPAASVFLALGPELVRREQADELLGAGGVGWFVMNAAGEPERDQPVPWLAAASRSRRAAEILPCPPAEPWPYLTHCTRRRSGPWPCENEDKFLDDLILDRPGADHSALAALWRIARSGRLMAGSEFVRGRTPVVSLTAVPLREIGRLRTYRSHLGRWDFEPYGICIRRDWLERRGTRPVRYGDEATWNSLAPADRPFFQKSASHTASGKRIDWTVEREWRHVGDLALDGIPADAALLFVASEAEARHLASSSPWPIVVLSAPC
jgi:hypothetical protein